MLPCWSHCCVKGKTWLSFIHVCENEGEQKKNEAIWPGKRNAAVLNTVSSDRISDTDCWDVITAKRRTETGRQMRKKSKKLWSGVSRSVILRGSHEAYLSLSHFREKVERRQMQKKKKNTHSTYSLTQHYELWKCSWWQQTWDKRNNPCRVHHFKHTFC